jgi:hypothetical protein
VADVSLAEEELTVQVGDFNVVIVSAVHLALLTAAKTHHSECLDKFATESTSADHEGLDAFKFALNFATEDHNLIIVATTLGLTINFSSRNGNKYIVMKPLLKRRVFASELNDFLSEETTEESGLRRNGTARVASGLDNHLFVKLLAVVVLFGLSLSVDFLRDLNNFSGIASVRVALVLGMEFVNGTDSDVQMF